MHFELLYESSVSTPLGAVRLIGEIHDGRGVEPKHSLRTIDSYGLTLIVGGSGEYQGPGHSRYSLVPGSLILTYPNRPHLFGPPKGQTWHEVFAIFEGPLFDVLVERNVLSRERIVLQLEDAIGWAEELRQLAKREWQADVQTGLASLLMKAVETSQPQVVAGADWLSRATTMLEADLSEPISMESVADALSIGYETFRKEFARLAGVSPMKFRTRRRLSLAAGLLSHTGLPISEIAARLGYPDAFTFSKAFKRQFGLSPVSYRKG